MASTNKEKCVCYSTGYAIQLRCAKGPNHDQAGKEELRKVEKILPSLELVLRNLLTRKSHSGEGAGDGSFFPTGQYGRDKKFALIMIERSQMRQCIRRGPDCGFLH